MTEQSFIQHTGKGGASYVGAAAVDVFRIKVLISGIKMHKGCGIIPTRGMTITKMFKLATQITGKTYKRGQHDQAIADLIEIGAPREKALTV